MNDKMHEMLCEIKQLASELGRTPSRGEYCNKTGRNKGQLETVFGGWTIALQAAGLEPLKSGSQKIDNSIFEKSIDRHLEEYKPRPYTPPVYKVTWASISDLHWPFHCQRVVDKFYQYVEEKKPQYVIINGDAWDMYSHSKYPRSLNLFTPREERALCLKLNKEFWTEVKKRHPTAKCYQLFGNHDLRPLKRILENYPAAEDWIEEALKRDFTFEGVTTIYDARQELMLDPKTAVFHGYRSGLGANRDYTMVNCINAHTHKGGTLFRQLRGEVIFEANSGIAGDPEAKGLTYTPQRITDQTPGFSAGDEWGPRFIPA